MDSCDEISIPNRSLPELDVFLVAKNGKLIMEIEVHSGGPRLSTYKWSDMGR